MNRKIMIGLILMTLCIGVQAFSESVDEIMTKATKAWGGIENMKAVKTTHIAGKHNRKILFHRIVILSRELNKFNEGRGNL